MYQIIINGEIKGFCEKPRWIKIKPETGVYIEVKFEDAIGVAFGGVVYNLFGRNEILDTPQAIVKEIDGAEVVFSDNAKITKQGENIFEVESALCELDTTSDERMSNIELALCELDEIINGGDGIE